MASGILGRGYSMASGILEQVYSLTGGIFGTGKHYFRHC